jgi:vacuolar-type H+-ATPase subunit H
MTESTELALPTTMALATMFKAENGLDPLLNKIKADALAMVKDLDPAVKKDRDLMRSAAFKVSQSKAEIDRRGKELTEAQRKEVAVVNAGRNVAETFLNTLRDQVKKPADDWEAKEAARITAHKDGLAKFDEGRVQFTHRQIPIGFHRVPNDRVIRLHKRFKLRFHILAITHGNGA